MEKENNLIVKNIVSQLKSEELEILDEIFMSGVLKNHIIDSIENEKIVRKFLSTPIEIKRNRFVPLVSEVNFLKKGGCVFTINPKISRIINKTFLKYNSPHLTNIKQLKIKYSKQLYMLLVNNEEYTIRISPKKLAELFNSPKSYNFSQFNTNILKKIDSDFRDNIKDINLSTNLYKNGVVIRKIVFELTKKDK